VTAAGTLPTKSEFLRFSTTRFVSCPASDAYAFLLIMAGHTERHVLQINEVTAAEGYPAK
jgi:hypothetical protein